MQTHYIRAREIASDHPLKHVVPIAKNNRIAEFPKAIFYPAPVKPPKVSGSEFSPLIQEFLDECGYSDR